MHGSQRILDRVEVCDIMIRGTTPTHTFEVPFDTGTIDELEIQYVQGRNAILTKIKDDCVLAENIIRVDLTQEETLRFKEGYATVQLRVSRQGIVMACKPFVMPVGRCLGTVPI